MSIRKIATIGHPILREMAREVSREELRSPEMQRFIDDLIETMRDANGAGLAAPQVYESVQICAVEVRGNPRYPYAPDVPLTILVNPVIHPLTEEVFENFEGCLSVPNLRGAVERVTQIRLTAWDRDGNDIDTVIKGLTAGTFQHEVDHLRGVIFVDRVKNPHTFTTWTDFERHHRAAFVVRARALVEKYGS